MTTISSPIDFALLMARPTVKSGAEISNIKQKGGWLAKANNTNKCTKKI